MSAALWLQEARICLVLLSTQQDAFYTLAAAGQKLRRELRSVLQVRHSLLHSDVVAVSAGHIVTDHSGPQSPSGIQWSFCNDCAGSRSGGPEIGRWRSREADGFAARSRGEAPWGDPAAAVCVQVPGQGPVCDAGVDVPARQRRFPTGPASISSHCSKALQMEC